ncbi:hypothetical protein [Nakamurella lactea]|uniref:hypothetical protein n=1 Tax=Nakamurella lactea TaxID=459515 RepID=UPI0004121961|nr:hypothetical protein [Nakamurella lactea]
MSNPLADLLAAGRQDERNTAAGPQQIDLGVVTQASPLLVRCAGFDEQVIALDGKTFALGDSVLLARFRGVAYVLGKAGVGSAPSAPSPDPLSGSDQFAAVETFSWRSGYPFAYQQDVRQGEGGVSGAWTGAWFYQGGPGASLAGVTVSSASVRVARGSGGTPGPQAAHLFLSSSGIWPTPGQSAPTTVGTSVDVILLPGEFKDAAIPSAWAQSIVDTNAGLMVSGTSPQVFLAGRDSDPESGLLQINWERA